ncbi:hypothetical protein [Acetobacterium malicum]|uniref:DUF4190 domain-containing protein n=1 Tax=Acetobacterium malicum TaxID=52692 RepID=A0ABR6YTP7_9FIRM|nr:MULTISPECIES: hypothetical protein [Acetobacterium]MBC3898543.1 hypothetical protein [Acetobacterium malicum]
MSFEDGMKGFTFGMISLICIGVNIILTTVGLSTIASIVSLAGLVTAIMAFVYGKKELAADPDNKKAKTGKTIGLVLIIINIVFAVIAIVALVALFGLAASM